MTQRRYSARSGAPQYGHSSSGVSTVVPQRRHSWMMSAVSVWGRNAVQPLSNVLIIRGGLPRDTPDTRPRLLMCRPLLRTRSTYRSGRSRSCTWGRHPEQRGMIASWTCWNSSVAVSVRTGRGASGRNPDLSVRRVGRGVCRPLPAYTALPSK